MEAWEIYTLSLCELLLIILLNSVFLYVSHQQQAMAQTITTASYQNTTAAATISNSSFLTYENNSTLGIKILYPANWEKIEYDSRVLFLLPSENNSVGFSAAVRLGVFPDHGISINDAISRTVKYYQVIYTDFHLIESKAIILKDNPAFVLVYTYADRLFGKVKEMDIAMIKNDEAYFIQYYTDAAKYSSYMPTIQKMIASFEIMNLTQVENLIKMTTIKTTTTNQGQSV